MCLLRTGKPNPPPPPPLPSQTCQNKVKQHLTDLQSLLSFTGCMLKLLSGSISSFTVKPHPREARGGSALSPAARTAAEQVGCSGRQERRWLTRQLCQAALASRRDEITLGLGCWVGNKSHVPRCSRTCYTSGLSFTASVSLSMQISQLTPNPKTAIGFEWHCAARTAGEKSVCPLDSRQDDWKASQWAPKGHHSPRQCSWPRLVSVATSRIGGHVILSHRPPTSGKTLPHHYSTHTSKVLTLKS